MKKYDIIREIGDGTFGVVYEGRNKETNQKVAIKRLRQKYRTLEEIISKTEVKVLKELNNEYIVQLKEVIKEKTGVVSYIFEFCDCNLFDFIENHRESKKKIPEPVICEIIFQIVKGMKYMHSKKFFHRDLKPENILVILNGYDLSNMVQNEIKIKIADFGTAKEIPTNNNITDPLTDYVCTRWYRAPECVFRGKIYDEKVDVWAIGCIMAELYQLNAIFQGENEFDQINQILKILGTPTRSKWPWGYYQADLLNIQLPVYNKKDFKTIFGDICEEGINILNEFFTFDSTKRPSCSEILNHPYFKMIAKPKNIICNSIKISTRKHKIITSNTLNDRNSNNIDKYKEKKNQNKKGYMTFNTTNNSKNNINILEKKFKKNLNKNNTNNENKTKKNNIYNGTYILKQNFTKKENDNAPNLKEYIANLYSSNNKNIKDCCISQSLSITEKKPKKTTKFVRLNEIKSGLVTKKILQFKKNKEERKNDEKGLLYSTNGRNENEKNYSSLNNSKKFYFPKNYKPEDKDDLKESKLKSIETYDCKRNALSTTKKIFSHYEDYKNEINRIKNNKITDIFYNNSIHFINDKSNNNSNYTKVSNITSSKNSIYQNSYTKVTHKPKINPRSFFNRNNTKFIYSGENTGRNSENNKNKYLNNHRFYVSNGKKNNKNQHKTGSNIDYRRYLYNDNYLTYNDSKSCNNNHTCIYSTGKTISANKNVQNSQTSFGNIGTIKNLKYLGNYYRNLNTPRNYLKKSYLGTNDLSISPIKTKINTSNSLFSAFLTDNKNNRKYIITKSESLLKNNFSPVKTKSKIKINGNNYKNGFDKIQINMINIDDNNNNRKKNIPNSITKKRKL